MGNLTVEKQEGCRCEGGCWHWEAEEANYEWYPMRLGVQIWPSLVRPNLELGTKIREAASYYSSPDHLGLHATEVVLLPRSLLETESGFLYESLTYSTRCFLGYLL